MSKIKPPSFRYRLLSGGLFFIWLFHALLQAFKQKQIHYLWQRLGFSTTVSSEAIWIHAASVGEVELVKPLLLALSETHRIVLTTFTSTGFQHALQIMPADISVQVLPIDVLPISRAFFRRHRFQLGLIAETELWPETLYQAKQNHFPLIQINARLSEKSLQNPEWIKKILCDTLEYFDAHLTRTESDIEALRSMQIPADKIQVCGNLKFAITEANTPLTFDRLIDRPYLLFASTRETEELLFAPLIQTLQQNAEITDPSIQLVVIAPRHPKRAKEIITALKPFNFNLKQRSKGDSITPETQIYLADTLGELKPIMTHARLVVMGGSFKNIGGHNILEPAQLGKAIITGPSDQNIRQDISLLKQQDAIIQVQDTDELKEQLIQLLTQPQRVDELSKNALKVTQQQTSVLNHYLLSIKQWLKVKPGNPC